MERQIDREMDGTELFLPFEMEGWTVELGICQEMLRRFVPAWRS